MPLRKKSFAARSGRLSAARSIGLSPNASAKSIVGMFVILRARARPPAPCNRRERCMVCGRMVRNFHSKQRFHRSQRKTRSYIRLFCATSLLRKRTEAALIKSEKLAVLGRLASMIAHEINSPLQAISDLLYLAQGCAMDSSPAQYLQLANSELKRAAQIADATLGFSRASGKITKFRPSRGAGEHTHACLTASSRRRKWCVREIT